MANIVVLGAGVMGSAFTVPLVDNNHAVSLVGTHLDGDIIEEIHQSRLHPRLGLHLAEAVRPYTHDRLAEVMAGVDLVVLGVNSLGIDWAAEQLSPLLSAQVPVLLLTKGLEGDGRQLTILPEALRSRLPAGYRDQIKVNAVGGPSIAGELAVRRHTSVIITGQDQALLDKLAGWLRTPYYHVWISTDFVGVELCVALKNVYALAVGLIIGLLEKTGEVENEARMHNLAAAVFAQGLWETATLVEQLGGQQSSIYSLPGAGDLYVTSQGGRNSRMGRLLGLGMPYSQAKADHMPEDTIEGAELALAVGPTVEAMIEQDRLNGATIPLLRHMIDIVCHDAAVDIPWDEFFVR